MLIHQYAYGDVYFSASGGLGLGQMSGGDFPFLKIIPVDYGGGFQFSLGTGVATKLGGISLSNTVLYDLAEITYTGTYSNYGPYASLIFKTGITSQIEVAYAYLIKGELSAVTHTAFKINKKSIQHSSLSSYTGNPAHFIRVTFGSEKTNKNMRSRDLFSFGFAIDILSQEFTNHHSYIKTDERSINPKPEHEETVSLSFFSIGMALNFAIRL